MKIKKGILIFPRIILMSCIISVMGVACVKTYSTATDTIGVVNQTSQSLADYLKNNYSYSIFYTALQRVGLDKRLTNDKNFTLFLPDDDAFARIGLSLDSIMKMDTAVLRNWMAYHIVKGAVKYNDIPQTVDNIYYTIDSSKIFLSKPFSASGTMKLHVNGDTVNNFDIKAFNGYIHVLNRPLPIPVDGSLQDYINAHLDIFSLFKQALQKFNLWDTLKNTSHVMTVFAPVNSGFRQWNYWGNDSILVSKDTIANWNTSVIPRAVFGVYFMPSRIFSTDYFDLPPASSTNGLNYIFPDQSSYLNFGQYGIGANLLNSSYNLKFKTTVNLHAPSNIVTKNGNCVLQAIDYMMMVP